ncbi:MAG: TIGR02253 family HAD-type hydrolase [Methanobrevibacter sp.]|jgi:putative hydrolase of the HAD superfamily|nr:TIGR02253 family HAD-type hydrolase [Candidatus Methanovirga meridionalis]
MKKAVFFDIDDTILDTSTFAKSARKSAIKMMVDNGLPISFDEAYSLLKEIIGQKGSNYDKHFDVLTKTVLGEKNSMLIALGMITYHNVKFALLRPFPKTMDILIYLKSKGYRLAVISNGLTIKQWEKLVRLNLHNFFDKVITSEEVGFEKPNKYIFDEALKRMECGAENSIMVGNRLNTDCMGAINAGMSSILVNSNISPEEIQKIKDDNLDIKIINNISELDKLL